MWIVQKSAKIPIFNKPVKISPLFGLKHLFSRLGIRQKIVYGYALSIGIAVMGATGGKIIENFYQQEAKNNLADAQDTILLLNNLQAAVLRANNQTPKLIALINEPLRLELEYSRILEYIAAVNRLLNETKSGLNSDKLETNKWKSQAEHSNDLKRSIKGYVTSINEYSQRLNTLQKENNDSNSELVQSAVLATVNAESKKIDSEINKVSEEMSRLVAEIQEKEAGETLGALDKARAVGNLILMISLLTAVAIATVLAIYTSRVIAHPIEATTKIAQQVTKESNFTLQAPVTTQDEVGILTTSLNQLIQRIAEYTEELKQAQTQLIQTEKMSSLGQMVAGIAHEINNPVSFIYGNIEHTKGYVQELLDVGNICQQYYDKLPPEVQAELDNVDLEFLAYDVPKMLGSMKNGAERIRQLVLSLRNFSRLDEAEVKDVDLHEGIDSTLLILHNRFKDKIELLKQYGSLPLVKCHPAQLNQVFMNLLSNAIDALLSYSEQPHKQIVIQTEVVSSTTVIVKIRDNGPGIPPEIQNKIFDPFFTTKPIGSGTGLGLSICYQIVEKHGGQISLNSQLGEGTEFAISIPFKS